MNHLNSDKEETLMHKDSRTAAAETESFCDCKDETQTNSPRFEASASSGKELEKDRLEDTGLLHSKREAEAMRYRKPELWGFFVAPVLMGGAWLITRDIKTSLRVGWWVFYCGSIVFAIAFTRFFHFSEKLKNVRQKYSIAVPGLLGPRTHNYRTEYDFSIFRASHFESHKKMHFWGSLTGAGICSMFGWFLVDLPITLLLLK